LAHCRWNTASKGSPSMRTALDWPEGVEVSAA
jgi:hypothetical protein